jgi:hypothetical protein
MTWIFIPITTCILLITLYPISSLSASLFQTPLKIAQFADLHFGEAPNLEWGPLQDINSTRVMNYILNSESPDFVVFSGDQITGNNIVNNATAVMRKVYSAVEGARVPFFSIFGNHDDLKLDPPDPRNSITSRTELLDFEKSTYPTLSQTCSNRCPNLLPSVSNYYQIITDPTGTPLVVLYFLDSGGGSYEEDLFTNITDWLQEITLELSNLTSLTFVHIPTPEYIAASTSKDCIGMAEDGITPTVGINNLLQVLSNTGTSRGIFTGHDHGEAWCCPFLSTNLCFGRHTGYGGYGSWDRGSRILQISQNSSSINGVEIKTWIRMEDNTTNSLQWL